MKCTEFRENIYHFQADELTEGRREAFQRHLEGCADCASLLELEAGFLRGLKARLPRQPAPPGLETRIRAALREQVPDPVAVAWYRSPWLAAAAAAVLLLVLLVPGLGVPLGFGPGPAEGIIEVVNQEVVVVDLDCDRAGMPVGDQHRCAHPHHINALKTADGRYWHISPDQEGYGELIHNREMRGERLAIEGRFYPEINTVHMVNFHRLERNIL